MPVEGQGIFELATITPNYVEEAADVHWNGKKLSKGMVESLAIALNSSLTAKVLKAMRIKDGRLLDETNEAMVVYEVLAGFWEICDDLKSKKVNRVNPNLRSLGRVMGLVFQGMNMQNITGDMDQLIKDEGVKMGLKERDLPEGISGWISQLDWT